MLQLIPFGLIDDTFTPRAGLSILSLEKILSLTPRAGLSILSLEKILSLTPRAGLSILSLEQPIRVKPAPTNQLVPKKPENPIPHLGLTKLLSIKLGIATAFSSQVIVGS